MKITYYSKYSSLGPSSRYRIFQFLDLFRSAGIEIEISELFDDQYFDIIRSNQFFRKIPYTLKRFSNRKGNIDKDKPDLTVVEHQLFPYLPYVLEKTHLPKRFLLEFDDAIYLTHPRKIARLIQAATGVIVGNETLGAYAQRWNAKVHLIPTVLNTDQFQPAAKKNRSMLTLGWSGLEYNYRYLQLITPVLRRIVSKFPVEIVILSGGAPKHLNFPYRFEKWDPNREVEQLNQFDIGLMPLNLDEWCKGKCGFKLLQYMALEIPSIATNIGVNPQIVDHGINGFLATDLADWETSLRELITNDTLRQEMGRRARSTVIEKYSTDVWFPKLLDLYRSYA